MNLFKKLVGFLTSIKIRVENAQENRRLISPENTSLGKTLTTGKKYYLKMGSDDPYDLYTLLGYDPKTKKFVFDNNINSREYWPESALARHIYNCAVRTEDKLQVTLVLEGASDFYLE